MAALGLLLLQLATDGRDANFCLHKYLGSGGQATDASPLQAAFEAKQRFVHRHFGILRGSPFILLPWELFVKWIYVARIVFQVEGVHLRDLLADPHIPNVHLASCRHFQIL